MPSIRHARRLAASLLTVATAWAVLTAVAPRPAHAEEPRPAKKDNNHATQPKEAVFSAKVTPSTAKPGDTVTFSVTARLEPGWHVYGFSKTQPDEGPRVTQFDLFDPAGLTPKGTWTPDKAPIQKKEPAFPELPFVSYHEDEVTWSIPLVVPKDAAPGKKALKVQAAYQLCTAETCSFPGQWTLPAATVTIVPNDTKPEDRLAAVRGLMALLTVATDGPPADTPKPAKEDNSAKRKPKQVTLTASVEPKEAKAGDTVTYKVTAKLDNGWHIYKYSKTQPDGGGAVFTSFDFFDPAGLITRGDWTAPRDPIKKQEGAELLEYFENEVTWSLPLQIPPGTEPTKKVLRNQAGYQICNANGCLPAGRWTLPDVELTILPGGAAVASSPTTPAKPAEAAPSKVASIPALVAPPAIVAKSDVEKRADEGLIPFLLACAGGGLLALAMPCVWPMIPITVNFFVKQGQKKKGATTGLAIGYCLAIIGVFTGVGLLFSIFFGAASLSKVANNPWLNFGIAGMFLVFGLSLLGLFEIRLPNFLLNASASGEGKGGVIGVMFMALTLTITSFTCTFPVVGGLLVLASRGSYLYPIIGMGTFALVLALPFFLLALSPGLMAKVPKSGDWMNAVKVVGGLVEIGAAFKFLNVAEISFVVPRDAFFNAYAVLTIWVVLALICGIYLLGLFRTDHDLDAVKVGPGRMILGALFLTFALFLTPALFGRPPQSRAWYLVAAMLPPDSADLKAPTSGPASGEGEQVASSKDPAQATREQKSVHGVSWGFSYEAALEQARKEGKPILIDFTGVNCVNCRLMEQEVLPRSEVVTVLKKFVTVQLFTDIVPINSLTPAERSKLAEQNFDREEKLAGETTNPLYVVVSPDETVLGARGGKMPPEEFMSFLEGARAKLPASMKMTGSKDPAQAIRDHKSIYGVPWGFSYEAALEQARKEGKPILIDFAGINDVNARLMEMKVFPQSEVVAVLQKFVTVQLYTDIVPIDSLTRDERERLANQNSEREQEMTGEATSPLYVVVRPDGSVLGQRGGKMPPEEFIKFLEGTRAKLSGPAKVASAVGSGN